MQSQSVPSLPDRWVERIWQTMRASYGSAFDRQWECPAGVDPVEHVEGLKGHWGRELSRFQQSPQAIAHALDNLPPHPPNLIEFRALCKRSPVAAPEALSAPKPDPERLSEQLKRLGELGGSRSINDRAWAEKLRRREEGETDQTPGRVRMTAYQRSAWREALGVKPEERAAA